MLKETKIMREADLIIYDEAVYTPEELAEALGLRFLVEEDDEPDEFFIMDDEEEDDEDDEDEDEEDDEDEEVEDEDDDDPPLPFPDYEDPEPTKRIRRTQEEIIALIDEAVNAGCKRRCEIISYTGLTGMTVDRYWTKEE